MIIVAPNPLQQSPFLKTFERIQTQVHKNRLLFVSELNHYRKLIYIIYIHKHTKRDENE